MERSYKNLAIFAFIIFSFGLIACDNNGSLSSGQARTENDFVNDPDLRADPENDIVVMFLESPEVPQNETQALETGNDIGEQGIDKFSYRYERDVNHTVCWEDDNEEAAHTVTHVNSDGVEVIEAVANGGCVSEFIPAGDYEIIITHDGLSENGQPIFFQPQSASLITKKTAAVNRLVANIMKIKKQFQFTKESYAQDGEGADNITTLINTFSCVGCDLSGANLANMVFSDGIEGVNLTGADLSDANLFLTEFRLSNFTNANLTGVTLLDTEFSLATWCDGSCQCLDNSFDECSSCESIDICTSQ